MRTKSYSILFLFLMLTLACSAQEPHRAILTYGASSNGVSYGILRGSTPGGQKTKIATGVTALTYTDSNLAANTQYCYQVVAEAPSKNDSAPTNEVCGTTDKDTTGTPGTLLLNIK